MIFRSSAVSACLFLTVLGTCCLVGLSSAAGKGGGSLNRANLPDNSPVKLADPVGPVDTVGPAGNSPEDSIAARRTADLDTDCCFV